MLVEEGIFTLWNAANNEALDLSSGRWEYGQVQTWELGNNMRSMWNQQWLIARVPGTYDYQIINSHYGVLAGGFASERFGNWLVKAGPISTDGTAARWKIETVGNGLVRFVWKMDESRCLDIDGGKSRGPALIWTTGPESLNQLWRLQRDDIDSLSNKWSSWMRSVPDDTRLSMLNIPGSHQSIALHGLDIGIGNVDNPHCQNRPPYEQLIDGIRYFDLRFDRWTGRDEQWNLYARHGLAKMGFTLASVLQSLKIFLIRFPSEVVFIDVRNESGTDGFTESWQNDYKYFQDLFFTGGSEQMLRMAGVTLGQVRGKVVCPNMIWRGGPAWRGT